MLPTSVRHFSIFCKLVSLRILSPRFRSGVGNISTIPCYAPVEPSSAEEKEARFEFQLIDSWHLIILIITQWTVDLGVVVVWTCIIRGSLIVGSEEFNAWLIDSTWLRSLPLCIPSCYRRTNFNYQVQYCLHYPVVVQQLENYLAEQTVFAFKPLSKCIHGRHHKWTSQIVGRKSVIRLGWLRKYGSGPKLIWKCCCENDALQFWCRKNPMRDD